MWSHKNHFATLAPAAVRLAVQSQEYLNALHKACQQLESTATGKTAETRLQKSLDKLHKLQQASAPSEAPGPGSANAAAADAAQQPAPKTAAAAGEGSAAQAVPQAEAYKQEAGPCQVQEGDVVMAAADELEEGIGVMKENVDSAQQPAGQSQSQKPLAADQADKAHVLAEKKAQREEAKASAA